MNLFKRLAPAIITWATKREPDLIVGGRDDPYLVRWWAIPRNRFLNVYVHLFLRSDDDRALHDHPWVNCSIVLDGSYTEHSIAAGGINKRRIVSAGDICLRATGKFAHRIELTKGPCWTLFITGPRYREWGFHCPNGWVHWAKFTAADDSSVTGKGCDA